MVKLDFFELINDRYEMAIPKITTTKWTKQVALEVATDVALYALGAEAKLRFWQDRTTRPQF